MIRRPGARARVVVLVALAVTATAASFTGAHVAATTQTEARPRLIVLIAVDQFRADYADWYGAQWSAGLHRLFTQGAVFERATIPWAITKTCAGHASIGTGAVPARHGLIANDWYDRATRTLVTCTSDPDARPIGLGGTRAVEQHSARWLLVPTLAEELRRQSTTTPRIVSIALKARAAIGLAGRGGDSTVVFWEEDSGAWATSSAFASAPWPQVDDYIARHRPDASRGAVWDRLLPLTDYLHADGAVGEPASGILPRRIDTPRGVPFSAAWDASPLSDAYIADLAATMVAPLGLGQRDATDLLAVGFSALDYVGHAFGPRSHEVQDTLVRLDRSLGHLLDTLDRVVGADRYIVGFTSDHGVALLPEQAEAVTGIAGGRLHPNAVAAAVDVALRAQFGRRSFIEAVTGIDIHLSDGVMDMVQREPGLAASIAASVEAVPGVARVFWAIDLDATTATDDAALQAVRASYVRGRSGDLTFLPDVNWVVTGSGTNHGSLHAYDREVPVVFLGASVAPGRHEGGAPIDVAPTLAAFAGITLSSADGIDRRDAITR